MRLVFAHIALSISVLISVLISLSITLSIPAVAHADISMGSCAPDQKATVSTQHSVMLATTLVNYTATAGFMEVQSADGTSSACVFYTAYTVDSKTPRPVLFAFNGGPGSASLWLHLGLLGPKRVDLGSNGLQPAKSPALIDNKSSPIDVTDIVMIDPVATGFSHTEDKAANDKFFGVKNDYVSIATFIQNFLNVNKRWTSPKYILGESYGGIRGPLLTRYLQDDMGIGIDGLILVSPALSDTTFFGTVDNIVPYVTFFPNFATTAWYHKRLSPEMQALSVDELYRKAQSFASTRLRDALNAGSLLSDATRERVAQQMATYLGLDKQTILDNNLRISDGFFFGAALKSKGLLVGRFDSRFTGGAAAGDGFDPSDTLLNYPFTAGINSYLRSDLAWPLVSPYTTSAEISSWPEGDGNANVMGPLATALTHNPNLKVMITSGYFDLACPMGSVDWELTQMPGTADLRKRISRKLYFGGHMSYINPDALAQMKSDLSAFITQ